ncbi:MAG: EVE domain-containing protein [Xanthomonadaceae bacterium]|jgi:predicted RNA-binding protein with PUA-like domain|nr:EVE domain-containing protein [Xanthomonadaceae bacterium]
MPYWLMKSEPHEFSIDDLARRKVEPWTGVRNYQARNFMRDQMKVGDRVLFYHSSCPVPGVAGIARIVGPAKPDPTQFDPRSDYHDPGSKPDDPRWLCVDVGFVRKLRGVVTLDAIRAQAAKLEGLTLLARGNRLSVFPLAERHYDLILELEPKP